MKASVWGAKKEPRAFVCRCGAVETFNTFVPSLNLGYKNNRPGLIGDPHSVIER